MFVEYAKNLPVLRSAALYPEDEFEARLVHGTQVRELVLRESTSQQDQRLRYLYEAVDIQRARKNVLEIQELYAGRCQLCMYDPKERYGHRICHGHHIEWLSRGGEDTVDNMVLACPNHHGAIHRDDAVFDYADLTFSFTNGLREELAVNRHLPAAWLAGPIGRRFEEQSQCNQRRLNHITDECRCGCYAALPLGTCLRSVAGPLRAPAQSLRHVGTRISLRAMLCGSQL